MALTKLKAPPMKKTEKVKEDSYESTYDQRPSLHITSEEIPDIKDWKVGEEYDLKVKVVMTSHGKEANDTKFTGSFRITHIGTDAGEEKE